MNESDISQKQAELYQATLDAFINESRKSVGEAKKRYREYVDKTFAKLTSTNGGYVLSQSGQPVMTILRPNAFVNKRTKLH
jgi:hypothetical protein